MNHERHLETFLTVRGRSAPNSVKSIREVAEKFVGTKGEFLGQYDFRSETTSLLIGHVQSGKTGHYLGIIAAVADKEPRRIPIFILFTQNSVPLQQQTYREAKKALPGFDVFDEREEVNFKQSLKLPMPKLVVLKKEARTITRWKGLITRDLLSGRSIFVVDDEADAASLNNNARKGGTESRISAMLRDFVQFHSAFFLQVTATPQAIFKQDAGSSIFTPESHICFHPGKGYLGGDFFFPSDFDPANPPYVYSPTPPNELNSLIDPAEKNLPIGLREALLSFLVIASYRYIDQRDPACNFLVHPSRSTIDHRLVQSKIFEYLQEIRSDPARMKNRPEFKRVYANLKSSKPQLPQVDIVLSNIRLIAPNITVLNSAAGNLIREIPADGVNIFIGGNVLSRGIVLPNLQVTYYCRDANRPSVDTYWQHARCFGYDRDETLIRVFMPPTVYARFCQMNDSVARLFESIATQKTGTIRVITPSGMNPTRRTVYVDDTVIVGGANYFPVSNPHQKNTAAVEPELAGYHESKAYHHVSITTVKRLVSLTLNQSIASFSTLEILRAADAVRTPGVDKDAILIVRRNRKISPNTGSLLSPNDRALTQRFRDKTVLVMYELTGEKSLGWDGDAFWVPNIKFPSGHLIHTK